MQLQGNNRRFGIQGYFLNSLGFRGGSSSCSMKALKLYKHTQILLQLTLFVYSCQRSLQVSNLSISSHYFTSSSTKSSLSSSRSSFCTALLHTSTETNLTYTKQRPSGLWQRSWNFLETWKVLEAHFRYLRQGPQTNGNHPLS